MTKFLALFLVIPYNYCVDIKEFSELPSEEDQSNFSSFPLVSRTSRELEWCKGVEEVEEVRRLEGNLYRKIGMAWNVSSTQVTDTNSGATGEEILSEPDWSRGYNLSKPLEEVLQDLAEDPVNLALEMDQEFYKGKLTNGFFIEAGASDGETDSHTLYFESKYNWTGLLVEPSITALRFKNRRARTAYHCLAIKEEPHYVDFDMTSALNAVSAMGGIVQEKTERTMTLQCIPLYTLLLAMGNPTVHWFILDIEGAEYQVLQTIPWHLVDIEMVSVETDLAGLVMPGSRQEIIDYMKSQGYRHAIHGSISTVKEIKDDLFVRKDVYEKYKHEDPSIKNEL